MAGCKKIGLCLIFVTGLSVCPSIVTAEVKSASACHSSGTTSCNYISLECGQGTRIRLLSMKYGAKTQNCDAKKSRCLKSSRDGCCAPSEDDCVEYYGDLHAYNLHRECSGEQSCGPLPVPNSVLYSCNSQTSSYVHVTYECIAVSDDVAVSLCRENNFNNLNGIDVSVVYNSTVDVFTRPTACSCFITSANNVNIDYVDIRMTKAFTSNSGSDCASAALTTVPDDNTVTTCDNNLNEEDNFVYATLADTNVKSIEVKLLDLYKNGDSDAPEFIWLNINAKDQAPVNVQCFKHADSPQSTTRPSITTSASGSSSPSNITDGTPTDGADDTNTGAIVAGVLVPIILLAIIGAVAAFIILRRRKSTQRQKNPHAAPNRYTDNAAIDNSVENSEYAEIGFVPDVAATEPHYDPVYEPKKKNTDTDACNGHGYQNVESLNVETSKPTSKRPKWPLGNLKAHTDRLISFFKKQHDNDFPQVQKRDKDVSDGSYDHLRPTSANSEVHVEVTPPSEEPQHTYSHTNDESVKRQLASNQGKQEDVVKNKKGKLSPKTKRQSNIPGEDINAVHIGDSYIEFQFGAIDENNPNLVKAEEMGKGRPVPPSRPPPSPSSAAKFDKTPSPRSSPKQTRIEMNVQENSRSKSPNFLTPGQTKQDELPSYDYAAGVQLSARNLSPRGSDVSDISSEHSYKILEEQPVYDYADVSDPEIAEDAYQSGSIYEDVEKDPRLASVKKHRSATDIPQDPNEYLEPITSRTRTISSPGVSSDKDGANSKPKPQVSNASLLKRELKEKTQQKRRAKSSDLENRNNKKGSNADTPKKLNTGDANESVKSDNVNAKDYQKVDGVKGVLNMAKMFENKDSDSDSSRQSSPRHIKVTNSPNLKKNIYKRSSDA